MQQPRSLSSPRNIYLSYSVFETELALQLAADLRAAGYQVWCDRLDLDAAGSLHEQVKRAIRSSAVLVAILTPAYLHARYARLEWEFAARKRYAIVPLLAGPITAADLPPELPFDARLDLTAWRDEAAYRAQFALVLAALEQRGHASLCRIGKPHALETAAVNLLARLEMRRAAAEIREMPDKLDGIAALALRPPSSLRQVWGQPAQVRLTTTGGNTANSRLVPLGEASALQRFVLTGGPGAGKSATLERLALDAVRAYLEQPDQNPLPLWMRLADWDGDVGFPAFLNHTWALAGLDGESLDAWLQRGRVALYLDGLNELGGWTEGKAAQLRDWLMSDSAARVVVTCRSRDYSSLVSLGLPVAELQPLNDDEVSRLAVAQLGDDEGGRFLNEIAQSAGDGERAGAPDLARTPASLNGLLILYRSAPQGKPASNLGGLFKRMLPSAWMQKRIERMPGWLPFMPVEAALAQIALYFLAEDIPLSAPADLFADGAEREQSLRAARNAGLIEVRDGRLRFPSRLLLEYFAAIGANRQDLLGYLHGARFDALAERAAGTWDVVVSLMAGMTPNPDALIRDVAEVDPFLASDCLASGVRVSDPVYDTLIARLLHFARSDEPSGHAAARALNAVARQSITPSLLEIMRTGSWYGRQSALSVLRSSEVAIPPALLRSMRDWDWTPQDDLISALRDAGPDAVALMLSVLDDPEWERRRGSAWALGVLEDLAAVPGLCIALTDNDGLVRREAAVALAQLKDPAALPGLFDALSDAELPVRRAAAAAIANLGEAALAGLRGRLPESTTDQRTALAEILGGLGVVEAVQPLLGLAQDAEPSVRGAAVTALGKLARPEAIPVLSGCLSDTVQPPNVDEPICYLAASALRAISTPEALAVVNEWCAGQTPAGIETVQGQAEPLAESDALLVQLVSPDWQLRRDAISALALRGDRAYLPLIAGALKDDDIQVRWAAARALGDFAYDPAAADALISALADPEPLVADEAVNSLARVGDATVPALIAALRSKNANVRASAVDALGRIGDRSALPALKKVSKDKTRAPREDQTVGALALVVIARLSAEPTPAAIEPVAALTTEVEPAAEPQPIPPVGTPGKKLPFLFGGRVKGGVNGAAPAPAPEPSPSPEPVQEEAPPASPPENITPAPEPAPPAVSPPPVVESPAGPDKGAAGEPSATELFPTVSSDTTWDDLPTLLAALSDPEWDARDKAAKDLRAQARALRGMDDPNAVGLLAEALRDEDYTVRWAVVGALAWLRDDATVPMLLEAMHDKHFTVRLAVIRAFEEIQSVSVAPALAERLRDAHPLVREKAAEAIGKLRANDAEDSLIAALSDREPFVRRAAAEALGELRLPVRTETLIGSLDDEDAFVRMAAAESLGRLGDEAAVPKLIEHLNDFGGADWDQQRVCDVAAAALEAIGTQEAAAAVVQWRRKLNQLRRGQ